MKDWLTINWLEILGAVSGICYILLSIKQNILLWLLGIITAAIYVFVFFQTKFYAAMSLQTYYFSVSIYGWYYWWKKSENTEKKELPVSNITLKNSILLVSITIILTVFFTYILRRYTDSQLPIGDAFTTAAGITGTWMLVKKNIEHWFVWIVVDIISMGLYYSQNMYPTVLLHGVYTLMAIIGFRSWNKDLKKYA